MKKSINAWSVPGGVPFAEMFRQLAEAGFEGVELNLDGDNGSLHALTENTTAAEAAEQCFFRRTFCGGAGQTLWKKRGKPPRGS